MMDDDVLLYPLFLRPLFPFPFIYNSPPFMKMLHGLRTFFHIDVSISQFKKGRTGLEDGKTKKICPCSSDRTFCQVANVRGIRRH
jgi:hypothetical protein